MPRKKTWEEIVKAFQNRNLILLSTPNEYNNKLSRLICMDEDGYLYWVSYDLVADKRTKMFSPVCKNNKYSIYNIQHWLKLHNTSTKILSTEYKDEKSPLMFECECGEIYTSNWNRMNNINKCRCNNCGEKIRTSLHTSIDTIREEVSNYGYSLVDEDIKNIKSIKIMDSEGNVYNANLFALRYGYIYYKHSKLQSVLEVKTANYLDEKGIEYICQYNIDGCKHINKLRFDFYLPKYNTIIEVHGEQHYKESSGFFKIGLAEQQARDTYKKQYCLENGYLYIEIPYTAFNSRYTKTEKYKEIINKILE